MTIEATRLRQQPGVESFFLPDGSCLLFDPASDEGYALNIAGALVWDYCDGELTGAEVAGELASLLPQYVEMQAVAEQLLDELLELGLLAPVSTPQSETRDEEAGSSGNGQ